MKVNYIKAMPVIIKELSKLLPIIIKYVVITVNEVRAVYNKDNIEYLKKEIEESLEMEEKINE